MVDNKTPQTRHTPVNTHDDTFITVLQGQTALGQTTLGTCINTVENPKQPNVQKMLNRHPTAAWRT